MTTDNSEDADSTPWSRIPDHVRRQAARAVWEAVEAERNPMPSINAARSFAADLIRRLTRTAAPGEHIVTCMTKSWYGEPGLAADLAMSRSPSGCRVDDDLHNAFGTLLMLCPLTEEPIGLVMRSCPDRRHSAPEHISTMRGWLIREKHAKPLTRGAIRAVANGGTGRRIAPHPALPPHPPGGTRYEKAYSLYGEDGPTP